MLATACRGLFVSTLALVLTSVAQVGNTLAQTDGLDSLSLAVMLALESPSAVAEDELSEAQLNTIQTFYETSSYVPIWVNSDGVTAKGHELEAVLARSHRQGLLPSDYNAKSLRARLRVKAIDRLAELEVDLSRALVAYAHDVYTGRVDPQTVSRSIHLNPRAPTSSQILFGADQALSIKAYAEKLQPDTTHYRRLIMASEALRHAVLNGGWVTVPAGETLKPGADDERVETLRARLTASGDMARGHVEGTVYDDKVEEAVMKFQRRHGLESDGIAGPKTLDEMNVPAEYRLAQFDLSLERLRWLREDLGPRHVFVNLADQHLTLVENDRVVWRSRLVVGKPYHATPMFVENMEYIVLNPNWNIPQSIAVNEMLPKLRLDPGSMARQNISIRSGWGDSAQTVDPWSVNWRVLGKDNFPYRLQQAPGPDNALGRIKFMFPNRFNIYIHDTPAKGLFNRTQRFFSHGCMRVEHPETLARHILDGQGWSLSKIRAALDTGDRRVVRLKRAWPVYVTYLTAWVDAEGQMNFRRDVYGRDERLRRALQR